MNKVRQLLTERAWSVSDLMRKSGLSWPTCDEAASEPDWPTERTQWGTITAIAQAFGVDPRDLISNNGNKE